MPGSTQLSIKNATSMSSPHLRRSRRIMSQRADNVDRASTRPKSDQNPEETTSTVLFLKLPAELRVQIYRYLLHAHGDICIRGTYADPREAPKGILRRHLPEQGCSRHSAFNGKIITYRVYAIGVYPAILSVNRQMYLEASRVFYSENRFNFYNNEVLACLTANTTIIPFFEDRSEGSRHLINRIVFSYIFSDFINHSRPLDRMFNEVCNYLSQNSRLERVTLIFQSLTTPAKPSSTFYKDHLSNLDKQIWIKQLVPLVKSLDTFTITEWAGRDDDLVRAAQTYLESKMEKANKLQEDTQDTHCPRASGMIRWYMGNSTFSSPRTTDRETIWAFQAMVRHTQAFQIAWLRSGDNLRLRP